MSSMALHTACQLTTLSRSARAITSVHHADIVKILTWRHLLPCASIVALGLMGVVMSCSYTGVNDGRQFVFVSSVWDDTPRPLKAGDEIFISYMANTPPVTALLNLGFVPEELVMQSLQTAVS